MVVMNPREISIPVLDYTVAADLYEHADATAMLLVFVGFGSTKERQSELVATIAQRAELSAVVLDFSGQREDFFAMDDTMPAQHVMEAAYAYDWIAQKYPGRTIHVMGTSYGGFIAAYLTRFRSVDKLVLRTPATYRPEDFYTTHRYIDKLAARVYRKDVEHLRNHPVFLQPAITAPATLVVVHGNDESVPAETTDVYINNFGATTYVAEGFAHRFRDPSNPKDVFDPYYGALVDWLK